MTDNLIYGIINPMRPRWWVLFSLIVAALSLAALYYTINTLWPHPDTIFAQPQLLFLTFLFLSLVALTIPISAFFNHRLAKPEWPERDKTRLLRQGTWVGLAGILLAYLQLIRALNWTIAAVLIGVFILIEAFFITRG